MPLEIESTMQESVGSPPERRFPESNFENKVITYLPFSSAVIVYWGISRLAEYYYHFNIRILDFLDFSEILISILSQLNWIIFFSLLYLASIYVSAKNIKIYHKYNIFLISVLAFSILKDEFKGYVRGYMDIWMLIQDILLIIFAIIAPMILQWIWKFKIKNNIPDIFINFGLMLIALYITSLLVRKEAYKDVYKVKDLHYYSGVQILLRDSSILMSDSDNYYIGNTHNYIFFYHEALNSTDILPMDRVNQINMNQGIKIDFDKLERQRRKSIGLPISPDTTSK